jgi:UDP-N-acetylglucosamine--N-acetylmuramyl-(pentapeptide) pyrophosphoryl-undecaprenol N-acetylglucosamine transferase
MIIAGGGTGGHLFPGVALAEELVARGSEHEVLFVGTKRGIEAREVPKAGFSLELIEVGGLKGKGLWGKVKGLFLIPRAIWQSGKIIKKFRPNIVVGVGGYASGPALVAAWLKGLPTAIMEQNAFPGLTNRVLGKIVRRVFTAFEEANRFFSAKKIRALGNPVRKAVIESILTNDQVSDSHDLLIFGGSQGAEVLNRVVPEAVALLVKRFENISVTHQAGQRQLEGVRGRYQELDIQAEVVPFINNMGNAYRRAELVICRAGATTVAELSLARKPSILVPFPYAADNHQEVNAQSLVRVGAAVMIRQADLDADRLADQIGAIIGDQERKKNMEKAAGKVSRPESAQKICDACLELIHPTEHKRKVGA